MTQDEAKAKWCPFGRIGHRSGVTLNDPDLAGTEYASNCIGEQCMAWRYSNPNHNPADQKHQGFCGLAGIPLGLDDAQR